MSERRKNAAETMIAFAFVALGVAASFMISAYPPPKTFQNLFPAGNPWLKDAGYSRSACNGVQCGLCPFKCFLPEGARGRCKVRMNYGGRLRTLVYSKAVSVHIDPIEKKPVYHLYPGSLVYSLAAPGCNLKCKACQNWAISQIYPEEASRTVIAPVDLELRADVVSGRVYGDVKNMEIPFLPPSDVVKYAVKTRSRSIAYTYSEPVIFYEYMLDTARIARAKGVKNIMVSGGYINRWALEELLKYMDVVKIDLKGFNEAFYRRYVGGGLEPVKKTLLVLKKNGVFFEIVNLVVPGLNDDEKSVGEMIAWIKNELGPDVPLFFSRFSPNYRLQNVPMTSVETLTRFREKALKAGLHYVYVGNVSGHPGESTYCPVCRRAMVKRYGYAILENLLSSTGGRCPYDGTKIPGIW